jgi:enolase-phosphatase E1
VREGWLAAPADVLFLSDVVAELEAAEQAGLRVCQIARPEDKTVPGGRLSRCGLPAAGRQLFGLPGTGQA